MTKEDILDKLVGLTAEHLYVEEEFVVETANFEKDLGADSLDQVELVMIIEKEFGIVVPDEEWYKCATVGNAVEIISKHLGINETTKSNGMTREEAKKAAEVMLAYSRGETLEVIENGIVDGVWNEVKSEPTFDWHFRTYRVKQKVEKTYAPYDVHTLSKAIAKHGYVVKRKDEEEYMMLGCWNPQGFVFLWSLDITPYDKLLKDWVWSDDLSACGELVISK